MRLGPGIQIVVVFGQITMFFLVNLDQQPFRLDNNFDFGRVSVQLVNFELITRNLVFAHSNFGQQAFARQGRDDVLDLYIIPVDEFSKPVAR